MVAKTGRLVKIVKILVNRCPICGSDSLSNFLQRLNVPVHQNLSVQDQKSALQVARDDLIMTVCQECSFIFNQGFDLSKLSYGENYDNTQEISSYFSSYLDDLISHLIVEKKFNNLRIIEVGCGKGYFIKKLLETAGDQSIGYGFDPSYQGPSQELQGRLNFIKGYYGPEFANIAADVVICRHVIEHISDPLTLLQSIRQALEKSPHPRVYFETPSVQWILQNKVIWDFFYEHCSLFNQDSITTAFASTGFKVDAVRHIFNGQYLWIEASLDSPRSRLKNDTSRILDLAREYARSEKDLISSWMERINQLARKGKVALWGAGAKGKTFLNLIDPGRKLIDCIADLNPNKQGCFVPGTGHPIVHYRELASLGITDAILMNSNYLKENLAILKDARLHINLLIH
jgi:SAM-dependent methyltransferase